MVASQYHYITDNDDDVIFIREPSVASKVNHRRRHRGRKSSSSCDGDEEVQPIVKSYCCVKHCKSIGTRLMTSMRGHFKVKKTCKRDDLNNKVCDSCYRSSLRSYHRRNAEMREMENVDDDNANYSPNIIIYDGREYPIVQDNVEMFKEFCFIVTFDDIIKKTLFE